jgi:amidohydrolase
MMNQVSDMLNEAKAMQDELSKIRRQVHTNPELSFAEFETSKLVAKELAAIGFKVSEPIGGTGFYADFGTDPSVGIRCDMDALPITEANNVVYRSMKQGVMHACGHDAHIAAVIGAARLFVRHGGTSLRILMQPGEEKPDHDGHKGSYHLVQSGAMRGIGSLIGLHVDPTVEVGQVAVLSESIVQSYDQFEISGSKSDAAFDMVSALEQLLEGIRRIETQSAGQVNFKIDKASASNQHLKNVQISGSFSFRTEQSADDVKNQLTALVSAQADWCKIEVASGAEHFKKEETLRAVMQQVAEELVGKANVLSVKRRSWLEQFVELTQEASGAFFLLGGRLHGAIRAQHTASFDIDETALPIGAAMLAKTALKLSGASK